MKALTIGSALWFGRYYRQIVLSLSFTAAGVLSLSLWIMVKGEMHLYQIAQEAVPSQALLAQDHYTGSLEGLIAQSYLFGAKPKPPPAPLHPLMPQPFVRLPPPPPPCEVQLLGTVVSKQTSESRAFLIVNHAPLNEYQLQDTLASGHILSDIQPDYIVISYDKKTMRIALDPTLNTAAD